MSLVATKKTKKNTQISVESRWSCRKYFARMSSNVKKLIGQRKSSAVIGAKRSFPGDTNRTKKSGSSYFTGKAKIVVCRANRHIYVSRHICVKGLQSFRLDSPPPPPPSCLHPHYTTPPYCPSHPPPLSYPFHSPCPIIPSPSSPHHHHHLNCSETESITQIYLLQPPL